MICCCSFRLLYVYGLYARRLFVLLIVGLCVCVCVCWYVSVLMFANQHCTSLCPSVTVCLCVCMLCWMLLLASSRVVRTVPVGLRNVFVERLLNCCYVRWNIVVNFVIFMRNETDDETIE